MDFEFVIDVTGQPLAQCDMESESFGDWLTQDIGSDIPLIDILLESLDALLARKMADFDFTGKIYHLTIAEDEVELFLNYSGTSHDEFEEIDPKAPIAGCGLVELNHLLESWREFIE